MASKAPMALQKLSARSAASIINRGRLQSQFVPAALSAASRQYRQVTTTSTTVSQEDGLQILANQRLHRPVAPHLQIYKWQTGSVLSSLHRITGIAYSGLFYLAAIGVATGPFVGLPVTSAGLAAGFGALPLIAKVGLKFGLSFPIILHSVNGVRFLWHDTGSGITNRLSVRAGLIVAWSSAALALGLCFL